MCEGYIACERWAEDSLEGVADFVGVGRSSALVALLFHGQDEGT